MEGPDLLETKESRVVPLQEESASRSMGRVDPQPMTRVLMGFRPKKARGQGLGSHFREFSHSFFLHALSQVEIFVYVPCLVMLMTVGSPIPFPHPGIPKGERPPTPFSYLGIHPCLPEQQRAGKPGKLPYVAHVMGEFMKYWSVRMMTGVYEISPQS